MKIGIENNPNDLIFLKTIKSYKTGERYNIATDIKHKELRLFDINTNKCLSTYSSDYGDILEKIKHLVNDYESSNEIQMETLNKWDGIVY